MNLLIADPHVPASAGHRHTRGLARLGHEDALAGRPMASEHPEYTTAHEQGALLRRVIAGEVIVVAASGLACTACGANTTSPWVPCTCRNPSPESIEAGHFVLIGMDSDIGTCEFRSSSWLRELMIDGTRLVDRNGEDCSHAALPLQ